MLIAKDQMNNVTQLITFADHNVQQMKIARVTTRGVILTKDYVLLVRYNFCQYWRKVYCLGCSRDSDCKEDNTLCDPTEHICRPYCHPGLQTPDVSIEKVDCPPNMRCQAHGQGHGCFYGKMSKIFGFIDL